jgi:hypothetical protein
MRRTATRALLACLVALILSCFMLAGAPPTAQAVNTYEDKILTTFSDDLLAYWPLDETEGSVAADVSGNGHNGSYSGVTLDQLDGAGVTMGRAGLYDGINDVVTAHSFGNVLSTLNTGTASVWVRVADASNWIEAKERFVYAFGGRGHNALRKTLNNPGRIQAGWVPAAPDPGGSKYFITSTTDWFNIIVTWESPGILCIYLNGANQEPCVEIVGSAGTPGTFGFGFDPSGSGRVWHGYIHHAFFLDRVADADEITLIADPAGISEPTPTPTPTALPLQHFMTLESGQPVRIDYTASAGEMLIGTLILVTIGLVAFLVFLGLVKRP